MLMSGSLHHSLNDLEEEPVLATVVPPLPKPKDAAPKISVRQEPVENSEIHLDAVSGLIGIGYKKSEARRIVAKACVKKHYQNAEDIVTDVISSVYK